MQFIALVSGGKDSIYNIAKCLESGHTLVAVLNLKTPGEKDSYMYQYAGSALLSSIAQCLGVPLEQRHTSGIARNMALEYTQTSTDEVEDLYAALEDLKTKYVFEGVSAGAIKSTYQKNRVEHVCERLGLTPLAYLWDRNQKELLKEMVDAGMHAVVVKSGSAVLNKFVGCTLADVYTVYGKYIQEEVERHKHQVSEEEYNICGEGGEYETITLDCPIFTSRIELHGAYAHTSSSGDVSLVIPSHTVISK
ncbi:diphthine-ammonia ligase [Nematocida sp. AWRm77]|nr:diphthine-ammonia ligase [Nematocida sp. AWRm77]